MIFGAGKVQAQSPRPLSARAAWTPVLVSAIAIWLAWQIILVPITQRAPPELAARLAPGSVQALSRASESEFLAGRVENADFLARRRLALAPFDVRSLRVAGLAAARAGRTDQANEILTLAGNWSLRDDPAHTWLIDHRLQRGDVFSAFAHADTLVRRREDIRPPVFSLFTLAASSDDRALRVVIDLLAASPPWAEDYFSGLYESPAGLQLAANLTLGLQQTDDPLADAELRRFYYALLSKTDPGSLATMRTRLGRPAIPAGVIVAGDFEGGQDLQPFAWRFSDQAGLAADIAPGPDGGSVLRIDYAGYGDSALVEQLLTLPPGRYTLRGTQQAAPADEPPVTLRWTVVCAGAASSRVTMTEPVAVPAKRKDRTTFSRSFQIPEAGCGAQWLKLDAPNRDRRSEISVWFDELAIHAAR